MPILGIISSGISTNIPVGIAVETDTTTADPNFSDVVLLYDMDGADAATNITDASNSAHTETFNGSAELDTAEKKFGTASLLLDGIDSYLTLPDSADWQLAASAGDSWTMECHFRSNVLPVSSANECLFGQHDTTSPANDRSFLNLIQHDGGSDVDLSFSRYDDGTSGSQETITHETAISVSTWYHYAVCSDGTTVRLFRDGVESATDLSASIMFNSTDVFTIGAFRVSSTEIGFFDGWIDNLRITKGTARYIANFTPPTEAFETNSVTPVKV